MRYGNVRESTARSHYGRKLATTSSLSTVIVTGVHIDTDDCWLAASPDGVVTDRSCPNSEGPLEIKCPFVAESVSLMDLCTKKVHNSSLHTKNPNLV